MNKRIAKKTLSIKRIALRVRQWRLGYGPEQGWGPVEARARAYLDRRRGTPYNRTMRIVRAIGHGPHSDEQIARLVSLWDEHRPFIWHAIRGRQWVWRSCPRQAIAGESLEAGRQIGEQEITTALARGHAVSDFTVGSLFYFCDRWCVSRMGRMDAMIDHLRGSNPVSST